MKNWSLDVVTKKPQKSKIKYNNMTMKTRVIRSFRTGKKMSNGNEDSHSP